MERTVTPMKSLCTPIRITKDEKNMSSEQISRTVTQLMKELFQHDMDMRSLKIGNERMQGKEGTANLRANFFASRSRITKISGQCTK